MGADNSHQNSSVHDIECPGREGNAESSIILCHHAPSQAEHDVQGRGVANGRRQKHRKTNEVDRVDHNPDHSNNKEGAKNCREPQWVTEGESSVECDL